MSRANCASVFIVSGFSAWALSAQAPLMERPVVAATATAGGTAPAVLWKLRRSILLRRSISLIASSLVCVVLCCVSRGSASARTAAAVDDLDTVAVRILDEEEARDASAIARQFAQRAGLEICRPHARVLAVQVIHHHREVAVTVAEHVGGDATIIDR